MVFEWTQKRVAKTDVDAAESFNQKLKIGTVRSGSGQMWLYGLNLLEKDDL